MRSCWELDLPVEDERARARETGSGRYSLTLLDAEAGDFEEFCKCVSCDEPSTSSLAGTAGWMVLRRRNGSTLAICRTCIAETKGEP